MGRSWTRRPEPAKGPVPGRLRRRPPGVSRGHQRKHASQEPVTVRFAAAQEGRPPVAEVKFMENLVPLFIIATAVAVVIQAGILVFLFVSIRKTSGQVQALATEVKTKALPTIETAQAMLV